jgi:hypothetical protein
MRLNLQHLQGLLVVSLGVVERLVVVEVVEGLKF